ncbi:winged helix-turn-helix transcriptional regulator [Halorubrum sp. CBA1125]|uniref:helix-turn-helix domain-containing protein n=1 Tax=Halorubrum sp. CBA1125 TaxID=2668072 RepID=UPI0012E7286F|nr:helix-turn-helix domain-containing protein [Halorubrum sp. CBA1125]MUW14845.1 winged helix-turn-helix transcriptional regulator [Halorubrum sp. CBA1125]
MADPKEQFDEIHWNIVDVLREGRATPSYLSERVGESRQLVSQRLRDLRLSGYVEKVHKGLYELVEDPEDDMESSGGKEEISNVDEAIATIKEITKDESGDDERRGQLRDELPGSGDLLDRRVDAILSMYDLLREEGEAKKRRSPRCC